jgi:long-subunit fatty acid transport protein
MTLCAYDAYATSAGQLPLNTKALTLANSVTAHPPGHMSMHYNPAGLSLLEEGFFYSQGLQLVNIRRRDAFSPDPNFEINFDRGKIMSSDDSVSNSNNRGHSRRLYFPFMGTMDSPISFAPVPISFSYREPSSSWTFAWGVFMPVSWSTAHTGGDPARFQSEKQYQNHLVYASPSIGYQVSNYLSVGVSLCLGQSVYGLESDMRILTKEMANLLSKKKIEYYGSFFEWKPILTPFDKISDFELELRDDFATSANIGVLWEPVQWITIGGVYRSPIMTRLKGDYRIEYSREFKGLVEIVNESSQQSSNQIEQNMNDIIKTMTGSGESGKAIINNYWYPQQIQLGVKLKPFEKLKVMLDIKWQNWSAIDRQSIEFGSDLKTLALYSTQYPENERPSANQIVIEKHFDDTFNYGVGLEYQLYESLCVRTGYEYRPTASSDEYFDLTTLPTTHLIGAGVGIRMKKRLTINLGLGFIFNTRDTIKANTSNNLNIADDPIHSPYPGQDYYLDIHSFILSANVSMPL